MNMIQRAILYIRVSTDEQAEKGYSLKHQEDRLRQYCQFQNIEVVAVFKEDHSAKTFERPEFNKLLAFLKKNKKAADLLLFLKWDRFSRNAGDAYGMINQLNKLGTEPQAIEQPLDLDIPENKIMLAFYLAAPEVENDRRSLNTIAGMRRAMKEGRHVTLAPRGYRNARNEMNRPIIEPNDDAILVKLAFEEVAKAIYTVVDVWRIVKARGLKVSKNQIWNMLRNKVYCGQIFIPAYKDEPEAIVQATHEPLISVELFNEVQDALNGRKRKFPSKNTLKEELPLRGFLECRKCGAKLTGSASKGNGGRYFYYHCQKGCNERIKAEEANKIFIEEVERASNDPKGIDLFKKELTSHAQKNKKTKLNGLQEIEKEIEKNLQRIENLKDKVADNEMPVDEYLSIKKKCDENISKLKKKLVELKLIDFNLKEYVDVSAGIIEKLPEYLSGADLTAKQQIIGSICPEKLIFEENQYRTIRLNDVIDWIYTKGNGSGRSKTRLAPIFGSQSNQVPGTGFEPAHPCERCDLNTVRLPISPPGQGAICDKPGLKPRPKNQSH